MMGLEHYNLGDRLGSELARMVKGRLAPLEARLADHGEKITMIAEGIAELTERALRTPPVPMIRAYVKDEISQPGRFVTCAGAVWQWQGEAQTATAPGAHEDWQRIVDRGHDGESFRWRGPHEVTGDYLAGDCVTLNGSSWIAITDDPGEVPGAGWRLFAQKGDRGGQGKQGNAGQNGAAIVEAVSRDDAPGTIDFLRSDGKAISVALPLEAMIKAVITEAAEVKATAIVADVVRRINEAEEARGGLSLRWAGTWREGAAHEPGNVVRTPAGLWLATMPTRERPAPGALDWALLAGGDAP